jgi:hypothetical protein
MADHELPIVGTVTLKPHWPGVRAYVEQMARSGGRGQAQAMASSMGCEAPNLRGLDCPNRCGHAAGAHAPDCPVGQREPV